MCLIMNWTCASKSGSLQWLLPRDLHGMPSAEAVQRAYLIPRCIYSFQNWKVNPPFLPPPLTFVKGHRDAVMARLLSYCILWFQLRPAGQNLESSENGS